MHPYQVAQGNEDVYWCVLVPCHKWTVRVHAYTHKQGAGTAPDIIGHSSVHEIFKGKSRNKWQW